MIAPSLLYLRLRHSQDGTAANVADVSQGEHLLNDEEDVVFADAG
jgi:hypothetical protein